MFHGRNWSKHWASKSFPFHNNETLRHQKRTEGDEPSDQPWFTVPDLIAAGTCVYKFLFGKRRYRCVCWANTGNFPATVEWLLKVWWCCCCFATKGHSIFPAFEPPNNTPFITVVGNMCMGSLVSVQYFCASRCLSTLLEAMQGVCSLSLPKL